MNEAKIQLSTAEMGIMCNAEIILTKNKILLEIKRLLEHLQNTMVQYGNAGNSNENLKSLLTVNPKISKGENYEGLPYLILDYPRLFNTNNIFTIRTMFWWGNFFSITLHLSGHYKKENLSQIANTYEDLSFRQFYIGVNENQWKHHFEKENYILIKNLSKEEFLQCTKQYNHLKLATWFSLKEINSVLNALLENWKWLIEIFTIKRQYDEKGLLTDDPKGGFDL
jgi:hypothetical protein